MNDAADFRVRLRPLTLEDAPAVFAYAGDPEVCRFLDWRPHRTIADSEHFISSSMAKNPDQGVFFAIEEIDTSRVAGTVELRIADPLRRLGEIGYSLAREYWGMGYNLEAGYLLLDYGFADLRLLRILGSCDSANRRSYRTMEKLGMKRERVLARARVRNGRPVDFYVYGILWREWARLAYRKTMKVGSAPAP